MVINDYIAWRKKALTELVVIIIIIINLFNY